MNVTNGVTPETADTARALSRLSEIALGYVGGRALHSACELGVFEALADGPMTLEAVAGRAGLEPLPCRRLLIVLAHLGLVALADGKFRNTVLGQHCTTRSPVDLGPAVGLSPFDRMCEYLTDALRENGPRWMQAFGTPAEDTFASLYSDPIALRRFAALMDGYSIPQGRLIAESYDFSGHRCLLDVAGGPGGQSIEIGLKHPHLRGIVMDLEAVCGVARERIEARGLGSRFVATAADLIDGPYPEGADVILLGHILHDWSDESCRRILTNCAAALPDDGVLLISESVLEPDFSGRGSACLKDIVMLVANESGARERSEQEYRDLLDTAGFDVVELIKMEAPRDLLVAAKR